MSPFQADNGKRKRNTQESSSEEDNTWVDQYNEWYDSHSSQTARESSAPSHPFVSPTTRRTALSPIGRSLQPDGYPGPFPRLPDPNDPTAGIGDHPIAPVPENVQELARTYQDARPQRGQAEGPFLGQQVGMYAHLLGPQKPVYDQVKRMQAMRSPPVPKVQYSLSTSPGSPTSSLWQQPPAVQGSTRLQAHPLVDPRPERNCVFPVHGNATLPLDGAGPLRREARPPARFVEAFPTSTALSPPSNTPASLATPQDAQLTPGRDVKPISPEHQHQLPNGKWRCRYPNCSGWQLVFRLLSELKKHQRIHEERLIVCDLCNRSFRFVGHWRTHMESVHSGVRFYCQELGCRYSSSRYDNLIGKAADRHYSKNHPDVIERPTKEQARREPDLRVYQSLAVASEAASIAASVVGMSRPLPSSRIIADPQTPRPVTAAAAQAWTTPLAPRHRPHQPRSEVASARNAGSTARSPRSGPRPPPSVDESLIDPRLRHWPGLPSRQSSSSEFRSTARSSPRLESSAATRAAAELLTPRMSRGSSSSRLSRAREQSLGASSQRPSIGLLSPPKTPSEGGSSKHHSLYSHVAAGRAPPTPPQSEGFSRRHSGAGHRHETSLAYRLRQVSTKQEAGFGSGRK